MEQDGGSLLQVTADEAIELANEGTLLVDVREQWEWDAGHAPQATHLPMSGLHDRIDELPEDEDVLVICHSGARSLTLATALAESGYRVIDVLGGMIAWEQAGGPVISPVPGEPLA